MVVCEQTSDYFVEFWRAQKEIDPSVSEHATGLLTGGGRSLFLTEFPTAKFGLRTKQRDHRSDFSNQIKPENYHQRYCSQANIAWEEYRLNVNEKTITNQQKRENNKNYALGTLVKGESYPVLLQIWFPHQEVCKDKKYQRRTRWRGYYSVRKRELKPEVI